MNRLYFYRSLITRLRQYLISKSGTNPVTLTNAIEDKLLQGFGVTGDSYQFSAGGKNLFNMATATKYSGLATLEVLDEHGIQVSQSGRDTWTSANVIIANSSYLIGKTITISADVVPLGGNSCIRVMWLNGSIPVTGTMDILSNYVTSTSSDTICKATGTVTAPPTSDSKLCLMLYSSAGTGYENNITIFSDIQIELGSVKTDYEQYYPLSTEHPSPIQTTELKKSSNLLHTDYFNEAKTTNGVTIQYLADEDCFLFNGTSTVSSAATDTSFVISNAKDSPFTISAFYVGGSVTVPSGTYTGASIGKAETSTEQRSNFTSTYMSQSNTNNTKICDKQYVKDFWFYFGAGVVFDNYKVKVSVTKLENNLCDTVPFVNPSTNPNNGITFTNNGDGSVTFNGTCTGPQSQYFAYTTATNIPADKTKQYFCRTIYSSAGSVSTYYVEYQLYLGGASYVSGAREYGNGATIPANTYNYNNLRVKIFVNNGVTVDNVTVRPQIFEIPTNYEPYNKYGLEIKQEKNILDLYNARNAQYMTVTEQSENKIVATAANSSNNSPVLRLFNQSIPAGNYVLSYTVNIENTPQLASSATTDRRNQLLVFANGSFKTQSSAIAVDGTYSKTIQFTLLSASTVILNWYRSVNDNSTVAEDTTYKVTFTNVQLEQGTEASTYTPYQPPKYNRIWIDKPLLGKTDKLTYDGTKLKVINKEFKINLKDDVTWSYIEPTESGSIGTIQGVVNRSADLYGTLLSNTTQSYLCTHYDSSFFDISRKHIDDGSASATRNTVLTFNGLQTDYDSFMEVINTGNVEMLIKYVNNRTAEQTQFTKTITSSSYIDLQPLSAGNNTLTVTNEISPTSCQYKYYSSKEN